MRQCLKRWLLEFKDAPMIEKITVVLALMIFPSLLALVVVTLSVWVF